MSNIRIQVGTSNGPAAPRDPDEPFCILVMGDFSGRGGGQRGLPAQRRPMKPQYIDRDNFDAVLAQLDVQCSLPAGVDANAEAGLVLKFAELEDFEPDALLARSDLFRAMMNTRRKLQDPSTYEQTARQLGLSVQETSSGEPASNGSEQDADASPGQAPPEAGLLDQILDASGGSTHAQPDDPWDRMIRKLVQSHAVPRADPGQAAAIASFERIVADELRELLHLPAFAALESAWRALFLLVRRLPTDASLKLYLLDCSRGELAADLAAPDAASDSALAQLLLHRPAGAPGWGLVVGDYTFGPSAADAELLGSLATIVAQARVPFVAGADPDFVGCPSIAEFPDSHTWQIPGDERPNHENAGAESPADESPGAEDPVRAAWVRLRSRPEAEYLALTLPRFLLRLPYGANTAPLETIAFEELPDDRPHEAYLWGNGAFACGLLLGEAFARDGWNMAPGGGQVGELPVHVFEADGESQMKPPAEAYLNDRTVSTILSAGLVPLVSVYGQDVIQIPRLRSLADPPAPLAGRFGR